MNDDLLQLRHENLGRRRIATYISNDFDGWPARCTRHFAFPMHAPFDPAASRPLSDLDE